MDLSHPDRRRDRTPPPPAAAPNPVWRLLALAWHYRAACVGVFAFQVVLLALGLGAWG